MADTPDLGSGSARIGGSSPLARTTFSKENDGCVDICTHFAHNSARPADRRVKFPVTIRHRASKAKIYRPAGKFRYYRVAYSAAKAAAERIVREVSSGSQAATLSAARSRDAIAAFERLQGFFQATGRRVSLLGAVAEFAEACCKIGGRALGVAVDGYLRTVVSVKRKGVSEAVEEFIGSRKHRSESNNGKRAKLSASYTSHFNSWLRNFASTFPGTAVFDLTKEHLNI